MAPRTGGEWVVAALRAEDVRHVFGIPGIHNLAIYDALRRQRDIVHVLARHEAEAAFMADGYARASGEPGVVVVTTGPGATNTLTPLAESYAGSMPVVVVMSDVASHLLGRDMGALHEVSNQIECFRPVTRLAESITDTAAIGPTLAGAFATAPALQAADVILAAGCRFGHRSAEQLGAAGLEASQFLIHLVIDPGVFPCGSRARSCTRWGQPPSPTRCPQPSGRASHGRGVPWSACRATGASSSPSTSWPPR